MGKTPVQRPFANAGRLGDVGHGHGRHPVLDK
jgi:hypothetical protein